jgi:hypothetical protein
MKPVHTMRRHPGFALARVLPWIGRDPRALGNLAQAADLTAQAGLAGLEAVEELAPEGGDPLRTLYRRGRVRFDVIRGIRPAVGEADRLMTRAATLVETSPRPNLRILREAFDEGADRVATTASSAHKANAGLAALPGILAENDRRTYLLIFQSPSEARGTGGVAGLYGVLEARDGQLDLKTIAPYSELDRSEDQEVDAPRWFRRRYDSFEGRAQWPQANLSVHFPTVAQVKMRMAEQGTNRHFDGAIAMDPVALGQLMQGMAPLRAPGLDIDVTSDNAADILLQESYLAFPSSNEQNEYLEALVDTFWERVHDEGLTSTQISNSPRPGKL